MTVKVSQADIDAAGSYPCNGSSCPIARAFCRLGFWGVWVYPSYVLTCGDKGPNAPLPKIATCFVRDFDEGRPVAPFSFEVEL